MKKIFITTALIAMIATSFASAALIQVNTGQPIATVNSYGTNGVGSYGASCSSNSLTLCTLINKVIGYLNQALFLLIGLAVVVFVWNVFNYFIKADADRTEAGKYVMYSVIGFFVILSMWGLVNILQNTFGLGNSGYAHNSWNDITNIFPR